MKIISLLENTAFMSDMQVEHGLSLYIETDRHKILFDMGASDMFALNAKKLGVDLSKVDFAIISHGHSDHGGGLSTFLALNTTAPVYVQRSAFNGHFNAEGNFIGLDKSLALNSRIVFVGDELRLKDDITLLSCNGFKRKHPIPNLGFTEAVDGKRVTDEFYHEQHLLIAENGKRVVISGCSHKGIAEIVEWLNPDVLIGGFHFAKLNVGNELECAAKELEEFKTTYYTCHCTGIEQYNYMKKFMSRLNYLACGQTITI